MNLDTDRCDDCGTILTVGDWPYCGGDPSKHVKDIGGYDPIEPYFDEDITERGEYITSVGQRRKIMSQNNLEYRKPVGYVGKRRYCDLGRR